MQHEAEQALEAQTYQNELLWKFFSPRGSGPSLKANIDFLKTSLHQDKINESLGLKLCTNMSK